MFRRATLTQTSGGYRNCEDSHCCRFFRLAYLRVAAPRLQCGALSVAAAGDFRCASCHCAMAARAGPGRRPRSRLPGLRLTSPKWSRARSAGISGTTGSCRRWPLACRPILSIYLSPCPSMAASFSCPTVVTLHDLYPYEIPLNFGFPKFIFNRVSCSNAFAMSMRSPASPKLRGFG